jgi:glutamine amidotransferase
MKQVCILDYGSGNVRSVYNLVSTICASVKISNEIKVINDSSHIILPGVGSFNGAMQKINNLLPMKEVNHSIFNDKKPFLGICVGMQVMADFGFEFGKHEGLGWIPGCVKLLKADTLSVPHIGWNNISKTNKCSLLDGINNDLDFYFLHSYAIQPIDKQSVVATADYGETFCAVVQNDNLHGVQFHPEKSQSNGKKLMRNFLDF